MMIVLVKPKNSMEDPTANVTAISIMPLLFILAISLTYHGSNEASNRNVAKVAKNALHCNSANLLYGNHLTNDATGGPHDCKAGPAHKPMKKIVWMIRNAIARGGRGC